MERVQREPDFENRSEIELLDGQADEQPRYGIARTLAAVLVLAMIGSGSAFLWHGYGKALIAGSSTSEALMLLGEVQSSQQALAADVRRSQETLQAQQAQMRQLSAKIATINSTIEALQNSLRSAQASVQTPVAKPTPKKTAPKPAPPVFREHSSPVPLSFPPEGKH